MSDNDSAPPPPELAAHAISFWDAQMRTVVGLGKETDDEFVSKERLRKIARMCIMQLAAMIAGAAQSEIDAANEAEASKILVPDTRIVMP